MSALANTAVYFIVEKHLERQAAALIESLKRSGTTDKRVAFALNPRGQKLSRRMLGLLNSNQIIYDESRICTAYDFYPLANKIFAWAHFEKKYGGSFDSSLYLDTDVLVAQDPESIFEQMNGYQLALSPVFQSKSAWPAGDAPPPLWAKLLGHFAVKPGSFWTVRSVVDCREIYTYFNSGVVFHKLQNQTFFHSLRVKFERLMDYRHIKSLDYFSRYFLEQASLSAHIVDHLQKNEVLELPVQFNYPLEAYENLEEQKKHELRKVAIIHYQQLADLPAGLRGQPGMAQLTNLLSDVFEANSTSRQHRRTKAAKVLSFQAHKLRSILRPFDFQPKT